MTGLESVSLDIETRGIRADVGATGAGFIGLVLNAANNILPSCAVVLFTAAAATAIRERAL